MPSGYYQRSEETKNKLRTLYKGRKHSLESRNKISNTLKKLFKDGIWKVYNNGGWNKGKKHSEETKRKIGEANKGNTNRKGAILSEETRHKISIGNKGKKVFFSKEHREKLSKAGKGRKLSERQIIGMRERMVNNPPKKFKDTSIEFKIELELKRIGINYQKQVPLCKVAIVDFYLPEYRIVIQCDGDYWHNLPDHKIRDEQQDKILTFNGFNVYRFWEHEINKSAQNCIMQIMSEVKESYRCEKLLPDIKID